MAPPVFIVIIVIFFYFNWLSRIKIRFSMSVSKIYAFMLYLSLSLSLCPISLIVYRLAIRVAVIQLAKAKKKNSKRYMMGCYKLTCIFWYLIGFPLEMNENKNEESSIFACTFAYSHCKLKESVMNSSLVYFLSLALSL